MTTPPGTAGVGRSRPPPAQPVRERDSVGRRPPLWLRLAIIPFALIIVGIGFYAVVALTSVNQLKRDDNLLIGYDGRPTPGIGKNFLVLSQSAPNRTEVVMLVHRNELGNRLFLVSLPSNLQVELEGRAQQLHDLADDGQVVKAVETLFSARIEHVATIDIKGFVGLADALGGLVVKNPEASTTPQGLHFNQGEVTLRGEQAIAFMDDESRIPNSSQVLAERQRSVLRALVLKVLTPETITNPVTFNEVATQLTQYVTVDKGLTNDEMWNLATSTHVSSSSDLVSAAAPVRTTVGALDGKAVAVPDPAGSAELSAALRNDQMSDYSRRYPG